MNDDKTPKPPEGFAAGSGSQAPVPHIEGGSYDRISDRAGAPASDDHDDPKGSDASDRPDHADDASSFASAPETETIRHTVVKTRAKKLPVFASSLVGIVAGALLVTALFMSGAVRLNGSSVSPSSGGGSGSQSIKINSEDNTLAEAVSEKVLPSVVSVTVQERNSTSGGVGSGVILDTDGNIITNYHVIENAAAIAVSINGQSYEAQVVGSDKSSDLAVIKVKNIDASKLTPIEVGDSDNLKVGQWVMAIGSPFGNEQSVSTGIVSSLYRSTALPSASGTSIYANMIQTDAAINPGNSGGALVNGKGQLIGINSIIESTSGSSSGVGFAIPSGYAINIAKQIIGGKTPAHPYIGLTVTSVNALSARQNNLSATEGALVNSVTKGSPAADAGIQVGDIITAVDGKTVTSADNLIISLREHKIGDKVTLTLKRGSDEKKIEVKLGSDEGTQNTSNDSQPDASQGNGSGNSMSEDEFLQYLQNLLGNGGKGGSGNAS